MLRERDGVWVGWTGETATTTTRPEWSTASGSRPCTSATRDYEEFYLGFSNATLWPLYHDAVRVPVVPP